ncbi:MAG: MBL fold metallo-hydrolase [Spirochaetaceae bacterium]|jgi:phosphoribosyl 1,2-cyclic phosphodiesterase|nr:MBL fold metallo-hydrolase [Spirochaetaceae bacterium]
MRIRFWGVRGSLPAPKVPAEIQDKIRAIIEQISPEDAASPAAKEQFLKGLPPWLFGIVGGNTSCVSLDWGDQTQRIVFDAGSGIRELGIASAKDDPKIAAYHLFFSHFHWDHIMGFPFFNPGYDPSVSITFYSPREGLEAALTNQMQAPHFPVALDTMGAAKTFKRLTEPLVIPSKEGNLTVTCKKMKHPGDSYAYKVSGGQRSFIYATDAELGPPDFLDTPENVSFFKDADIAVIDSQYTLQDAIEKYNWGHSSFRAATDFAAKWGIKHLVLFHHEPTYNDREVYNILQSAQWYAEEMQFSLPVTLAVEGLELIL